ncbi:DNA topoisomerase II [Nematocida homosporus]|uniref:DNA topoisomerase II n=1 Tax=Nematocida homosporus TaxID=1912981 RepID=UPI00221FD194|nr:DNA topoisomerase II [Nematocida homosporus]KAI5187861.1 DNA topoisomerase II [Nematocida homosporus]
MAQAKRVEEIYQKKTPIEHVLIRPDSYIGSIQAETRSMFVWSAQNQRIVRRDITYVPGLYKIFDEILVNAADNKTRDPKMTTIEISVNRDTQEISVFNDGAGIPVVLHAEEGVYIPELIFGHLLTSSNYDDAEKKITGGRNGYGAKLCNIFSTRFEIETADRKSRKKFHQVFTQNMLHRDPPTIETYTGLEFTRVTFIPDLARFGLQSLDEDFMALAARRAYDLAGTVPGIKVVFNGQTIPITDFRSYISLYVGSEVEVVHEAKGRWEVGFVLGEDKFQHVSFVNRIATPRGGTHMAHVVEQIITAITEALKKHDRALNPKPALIKSHLFIFLNCLIENPAFDSQTKETLTLRPAAFGSTWVPSSKFLSGVLQSGIVERIVSAARARQTQQLRKTDGHKTSKLRGIPKLDDANNAGTKHAAKCTLILTEGDSAKALAVSGLAVVGRDNYGVFPLRGKLLNVREATHKQLLENAEINSIKKILGLQHGKTYDSVAALRYGRVMIMADQDHDGSHIKGLVINMLEHFFPSLLRIPGFLMQFITPIVKAFRGNDSRAFFTLPEFDAWRAGPEGRSGQWRAKYYKGLGTSTAADAKAYFSALSVHVKEFAALTPTDSERLELAFSKKKVECRKDWLRAFVPGTFLDNRAQVLNIAEFVDRELIHFSVADNIRSIPSVIDGLKPGQRKVLYCCFKRRLVQEIKVAQLAGYVSEHSAYHHGEQSLCQTIVHLAQDFVGSNNLPLLKPIGQFGTRLQGGKDAASARYIYTALSNVARLIFPAADDELLVCVQDDGIKVEPVKYVPIIPMLLVNGSEGIGTGWSTNVPAHSPRAVCQAVRAMIKGEVAEELSPWWRGFVGSIEQLGMGKWRTSGRVVVSGQRVEVRELPIGLWTQNYKDFLETLVESGEIRDFREHNTDTKVLFEITGMSGGDLEKRLRLTSSLSTGNMVAFDATGRLQRYSTANDILAEFCAVRRELYVRRKAHVLQKLGAERMVLENRVRFIGAVVSGELQIVRRSESEVEADLERAEYARKEGSYDYLLNMSISTLTAERQAKLAAEAEAAAAAEAAVRAQTPEDMWLADLDALEAALPEEEHVDPEAYKSKGNKIAKGRVSKGKNSKGKESKVVKGKSTGKGAVGMSSKKVAGKGSSKSSPKPTANVVDISDSLSASSSDITEFSSSDVNPRTPKRAARTAQKPKALKTESPQAESPSKAKPWSRYIDSSSESNQMEE